ncbi:MAG: O-antigen ligase family protein [Phycisphaera sp.]|nr:MAG: O-antigen ligase family protein [Phycisphaera sp.]
MAAGGLDLRSWLMNEGPDHGRLWDLNTRANQKVRWGHQFHIFVATLTCLNIALPMSYIEVPAAVLIGMLFARLYATWRLYPAFLKLPIFLAATLFALMSVVALTWSADPAHGLDDIDSLRWFLLVPALWPLRHLRRWFIFCVTLSYLAANTCQLVQALAFEFGWEHLDFDAYPDRISGWLSPASGGSVLIAALGLHLPAALKPTHPLRWPARVLSVISLIAVFATGARGAWIAAALLVAFAIAYAVWQTRQRTKMLIASCVLAIVAIPVGWIVLGDEIQSRVDEANREIRGALESEDYATSTGARINMWIWGGRAFADNPLVGVGTGGYKAWVQSEQVEHGIDPETQPIASHAHGMYVHLAATHGAIGLLISLLVGITILFASVPREGESDTYQAGLFMGIVGVLLAGLFDTVYINSQTAAVLWLFVALSLRPSNKY